MKELGFKESFAIIALNGLDPDRMTTAKKVALKCIVAAGSLETFLDGGKDFNALEKELRGVRRISLKRLKAEERDLTAVLRQKDLISRVPNLLGCDMYYCTGGISIFEYQSDPKEYAAMTEYIRAELLEGGNISDEIICLWWLLRESGCFYDFFSKEEKNELTSRLNDIYIHSELAKRLFAIDVQKPFNVLANKYLKKKKEIFTTQIGTGFLFIAPFFQRCESVFIDMNEWFSNKDKRLDAIINRLSNRGMQFELIRGGTAPLIKIHNIYYECIPTQTSVANHPIQGVRLRRYILKLT